MIRITPLNSFSSNNLQTLRAGSLLVQQIVDEQFAHVNNSSILDAKKIGIVATERVSFSNEKYLCIISALCEGLNFELLKEFPLYDYNEEKTVLLTSHVATEILPVIRVALNEDKTKVLILGDNVKFDFFKFKESKAQSTSLLLQLISNQELLRKLSSEKVRNLDELVSHRPSSITNSFSKEWRKRFILDQKKHLSEMQLYAGELDLVEHYEELLKLELGEKSI